MHEEQLGLIQQYTNITHLKTCLHYLEKGISRAEKNFILVNQEDGPDDSSSEEEETKSPTLNQKKPMSGSLNDNHKVSEGFRIFEMFMHQEGPFSRSVSIEK